jgi:RNA polymerase sigma-70 factor (ECF subfamily)
LPACIFERDGGSSKGVRDHDIERLFAEHSQRLYAFVAYRTGDASVAEEIVGDTFERVVRTRRRFDRGKGSEQTWIYTIALNLVTDHQRRSGVERRALDSAGHDGHDDVGDPLARVADRDELSRALDRLEPDVREVLALRYGADLRLKDIAKLTGRPLSTVHERLHRGLRSLQAELERDDAPSPAPGVARSRHGR